MIKCFHRVSPRCVREHPVVGFLVAIVFCVTISMRHDTHISKKSRVTSRVPTYVPTIRSPIAHDTYRDAIPDHNLMIREEPGHKTDHNRILPTTSPRNLSEGLKTYAMNRTIYIAVLDITYVALARNLYATSIKRFGLENHLFVGLDDKACESLQADGAHCVTYGLMKTTAEVPALFESTDYNRKACAKLNVVYKGLTEGYTIILVDLDIVFFQNPIKYLMECPDCDLVIQQEGRTKDINSGFYLIRPSDAGKNLLKQTLAKVTSNPKHMDQTYMRATLSAMVKQKSIKLKRLDPNLFANGDIYYTVNRRMFKGDKPSDGCVMVHNNFIVSAEAKVYRFKETGDWHVDSNEYYSSATRRYIVYENPVGFGTPHTTRFMEAQALRAALTIGAVLGRTVIFPRFHCVEMRKYKPQPGEKCTFGVLYSVRHLDRVFASSDVYRESSFLQHPMVPETVRKSQSEKYIIRAETDPPRSSSGVIEKVSTNNNVTAEEIRSWFGDIDQSVLVFQSLYVNIMVEDELKSFVTKLREAIITSDYQNYYTYT